VLVTLDFWTSVINVDHHQLYGNNYLNHNHKRKLNISTALTKAKSREPAYSQADNPNKIDRQEVGK